MVMHTLDEIREALRRLPINQRLSVELWLQELDGTQTSVDEVREARPAYAASSLALMTLEEFFAFEEQSPVRHEFIDGAMFAMAGASRAHNLIAQNLAFAIRTHFKTVPCKVFLLDMKLVIRRDMTEICYYPDVVVDCRPDKRDTRSVQDPRLIVEVLSPSTQLVDQREKLQNYRRIDSVEEYVLVAQDERRVIVYPRAERWKPRVYGDLDTAMELRSIDLTVSLTELYADVGPFV